MKRCSVCNELGSFREHRKVCRGCEAKQHYRRNNYKQRVLSRHKQMKGCKDCGITDWRVLDYDHRNPAQKEFTIGKRISSKGLRTLAREIRKCDVRCSNCHRIKSYENNDRNSWRNRNEEITSDDSRSFIERDIDSLRGLSLIHI